MFRDSALRYVPSTSALFPNYRLRGFVLPSPISSGGVFDNVGPGRGQFVSCSPPARTHTHARHGTRFPRANGRYVKDIHSARCPVDVLCLGLLSGWVLGRGRYRKGKVPVDMTA